MKVCVYCAAASRIQRGESGTCNWNKDPHCYSCCESICEPCWKPLPQGKGRPGGGKKP
jgi:hypothetical protein